MYKERVVEKELGELLKVFGAVVVEGPKACGKTETAKRYSKSMVFLDTDENARMAVNVDPKLVLNGASPRLLDEWQIEPKIWNHIRREVDERGKPGQFILTGSAAPADDITRHTGAGRLVRMRMRPMSLFESGHSNGDISMASLLSGHRVSSLADTGVRVNDLAEYICRGGWPANLEITTPAAERFNRAYVEEIRRTDVHRVDEKSRDPVKVGALMSSLARNVSTEVAMTTLAQDAGGAGGSLSHDTVRDYLQALERLMVIEDQPAWSPHLRSKSILRNSPKRHFVDPSLAAAAIGVTHQKLLQDLKTMGSFFESLVVRDLRIYAQSLEARVCHYRDNTGLEVDCIVEQPDGTWAAFEVKLAPSLVPSGVKSLQTLAERVDTKRCGKPAALGVIVGSGHGYTREDGIHVIPIGMLGP